jgi:hypothetical protein
MQRRTLTSSAANALKYVSIVFFLPEGIFTEEISGTVFVQKLFASVHIYMSACLLL